MKHNISCDCRTCYARQRESDRFLFAIGLWTLILVASVGYFELLRAGLFGWLRF